MSNIYTDPTLPDYYYPSFIRALGQRTTTVQYLPEYLLPWADGITYKYFAEEGQFNIIPMTTTDVRSLQRYIHEVEARYMPIGLKRELAERGIGPYAQPSAVYPSTADREKGDAIRAFEVQCQARGRAAWADPEFAEALDEFLPDFKPGSRGSYRRWGEILLDLEEAGIDSAAKLRALRRTALGGPKGEALAAHAATAVGTEDQPIMISPTAASITEDRSFNQDNFWRAKTGAERAFVNAWKARARLIQQQPGALGVSLLRSSGDPQLFVSMACWESPEAREAAMRAVQTNAPDEVSAHLRFADVVTEPTIDTTTIDRNDLQFVARIESGLGTEL